MPKILDLTGTQFGRLTAVKVCGKTKSGAKVWECVCVCGNRHTASVGNLRGGSVRSCGCLEKEAKFRHGGSEWPEYEVWMKMISRCNNKKDKQYKDYGGRGIRVFDEWKSDFGSFIHYVGRRPSDKHTIERIDNDGNYEPGNVKWATRTEQARNNRHNHLITFNGKTQCLAAWAEEVGIPQSALYYRIVDAKWTVERAITTPSQRIRSCART